MKQLLFISFLYILGTDKSAGQCSLIIHQVGTSTDTIFVANYEEDHQPKKINDSTYKLIWNTSTPERICLVLDRPTRWWTTIWMEPNIKNKEIIIDYSKKEIRLINASEWDSVCLKWMGKFPYHGDSLTDNVAINFVKNNPDSYLSLFFLTHGVFRENPEKKRSALNMLSPTIKRYPEFKQAMASLNERKYPNIGDTFKEFTLNDNNERPFNSSSINNKIIILHFWSTNCGPCVKGMGAMVNFYKSLDTTKIAFISVSLDDDKNKWKKATTTNKIIWTNLWTEDNSYCDLCLNYNLTAMPYFVIFNKEKKITFYNDGEDIELLKSKILEINKGN